MEPDVETIPWYMRFPEAETFPWSTLKVCEFNIHDQGTTVYTYVKKWVNGKAVWRGL